MSRAVFLSIYNIVFAKLNIYKELIIGKMQTSTSQGGPTHKNTKKIIFLTKAYVLYKKNRTSFSSACVE